MTRARRPGRAHAAAGALLAAATVLAAPPASACGLALILAIDVSSSVDPLEYRLQSAGHAAAFRDPEVIAAIAAIGGVRAMAMHWSGDYHQQTIAGWTRLDTPEAIAGFAATLEGAGRRYDIFGTALGAALDYLGQAWTPSALACARQVIDVSGDGVSNSGLAVETPRARLLEAGVTINGLVIVNDQPVEADPIPFYRERVIGGPGAFMMVANGFEDYAAAFKKKLLREIGPPVATLDAARLRSAALRRR